jgi:hypothetical protein
MRTQDLRPVAGLDGSSGKEYRRGSENQSLNEEHIDGFR